MWKVDSSSITGAAWLLLSDYFVGVYDAGVEVAIEDEQQEHHLQIFCENRAVDEESLGQLHEEVTCFVSEMADVFQISQPRVVFSTFDDEDWSRVWKKFFTPFTLVPGLVIKPSWEVYQPVADEVVIELDPGMAFGTGQHATTQLCMEHLRDILDESSGAKVLDVGTGTGILAMAAALWGAEAVVGLDNDPVAVEVAQQNVARNSLSARIAIEETAVEDIQQCYDVVVANIVHDVLFAMAPVLWRVTKPGGAVVLSGIQGESQKESLRARFVAQNFHYMATRQQEEWFSLRFQRMATESETAGK